MFKKVPPTFDLTKEIKEKTPLSDPAFTPVLPYHELLKSDKHQELLKSIRGLISLPTAEYEAFYFKAITNFVEFVQQLPETSNSYYSHKGGFLDHGLERANMALTLCRTYLLPEQSNPTQLTPLHELWLYAIFTAALLLDVGKLATKQIITLYDNQGKKVKLWQPSTGSMAAQAPYYQYEYAKENLNRLRNFITPILARQLLSSETSSKIGINGFDWIASNNEILEAWLAILNGDQTGGSFILTVIPIAQAQTIANYFAEHNKSLQNTAQSKTFNDSKPAEYLADTTINQTKTSLPADTLSATNSIFQPAQLPGAGVATASTNTFSGSVASSIAPTVTAGIAFLNWLQKNIQQNKWVINAADGPIQRVNDGLFLSHSRLIQEFCRENPGHGTVKTVQTQFTALEVALGGGTIQSYYATQSNYKKIQHGIIVSPHLFLKEAELAGIPLNERFIKLPAAQSNPHIVPIVATPAAIAAANRLPGAS